MEKIIKKFITFKTRSFSLEHLLETKLEIFLPKEVYDLHYQKFISGTPQEKGLLVECLLHLQLKRMYSDYSHTEDCLYPYDGETRDGTMFDFKYTGNNRYNLNEEKILRAQSLSIIHSRPFHFILVSPERWNGEEFSITLAIHHVITLESLSMSHIYPEGSSKSISIYKERRNSYESYLKEG
jgi:hypothetical protein